MVFVPDLLYDKDFASDFCKIILKSFLPHVSTIKIYQ